MIASTHDLLVMTEADFERLPEDGRWEVVDGRAILLPASDVEHQFVCDALVDVFSRALKALGVGKVVSATNVRIPVRTTDLGLIQNRIPDVVVFRTKPRKHFALGSPPELVIEVLATRRGNVERTEKIEDYALAGIGEYWIVNPIDRLVEIYRLSDGEYSLAETVSQVARPAAFPGLEINLVEVWAALD